MLAPLGLEEKLAKRAGQRKLEDLSVGPVLTWTTEAMLGHVDKLLQIPGKALTINAAVVCTIFLKPPRIAAGGSSHCSLASSLSCYQVGCMLV